MSAESGRISTTFTKAFMDGIDGLVEKGLYLDRQTVIRDAVRLLLMSWHVPVFYPEAEDDEHAVRTP